MNGEYMYCRFQRDIGRSISLSRLFHLTKALYHFADRDARYIYRIENEDQKPSFDVLYKIIRTLSMAPDRIFYPEAESDTVSETEVIYHMLYRCDKRALRTVHATVSALIEDK